MIISSRWQTSTIKHHVEKTHPETCSDISVLNNPAYPLILQIYLTLVSSDKYIHFASLMSGHEDPTEDCAAFTVTLPGFTAT